MRLRHRGWAEIIEVCMWSILNKYTNCTCFVILTGSISSTQSSSHDPHYQALSELDDGYSENMSSVDGGGTVMVHEPPQYSDPATAGVTTQHPSLLETQPSGELQTGEPGLSRPRLTNLQSVPGYTYTDLYWLAWCIFLSAFVSIILSGSDWLVSLS